MIDRGSPIAGRPDPPSTVVVVPYDDGWPDAFERERARLAAVFGSEATIEHVGSTAVPGLFAKPIIDIMVGMPALGAIEMRTAAMQALGYDYVPQYEREMPERRYFRRPSAHPRTHHVHGVVTNGEFWRVHLAFRDYLRTHPQDARAYGELKRALAARHGFDRRAYLEGKSTFVESILARAAAGPSGAVPNGGT